MCSFLGTADAQAGWWRCLQTWLSFQGTCRETPKPLEGSGPVLKGTKPSTPHHAPEHPEAELHLTGVQRTCPVPWGQQHPGVVSSSSVLSR